MLVTIDHARKLGYCSKSLRLYAERYNINLKDFVLRGIDSEVLLGTDDALLLRLVQEAEKDIQGRS